MTYKKQSHLFTIAAFAMVLSLAGCAGDDGAAGANGQDVDPAVVTGLQDQISALNDTLAQEAAKSVNAESCAICHTGDVPFALGGAGHQAEYDKYNDASTLMLTVDGVANVDNGDGTFTSTMTFTAMKNGVGLTAAEVAALAQKAFYASTYDSTTGKFNANVSYVTSSNRSLAATYVPTATPGQFEVTTTTAIFAPGGAGVGANAQAYAYIADGVLDTEGMTLYDDVANAAMAFGDAATYVSAANVTACEGCHGMPYQKHGYRAAKVAGISDFGGCKNCHVDTTNGTHPDWQLLADNPARYAELDALAKAAAAASDSAHDSIRENMTADELTKYQYNRSLMNDVHMSHNMEFPYPQEMSNCATCHEGKLSTVLVDNNFSAETCSSCHAVDNLIAKMRAAPIHDTVDETNLATTQCNSCHTATAPVIPGAPLLSALHNGGYNPEIYSAPGVKYSEVFTVSIPYASFDSVTNILTVRFKATENAAKAVAAFDPADIVPTVMIGLYGYDTKDFIVNGHRDLEYNVGQGAMDRFTEQVVSPGVWKVTADLSTWADMITDGAIKRVEIIILPALGVNGPLDVRNGTGEYADDNIVAMNAPSRTFDLVANAFDDTFFSDIVKVDGGCNNCHDALATTFHDGKRGGNIKACRFCHNPNSGGSHLEMQSRSIDSYVHAVHSFQAFDPADIDFSDPVAALEYEHHVEHTYPNFTIKNCESCHVAGTYEVPNQSRSLSGKLSAADSNYADFDKDGVKTLNWDRSIGAVPSYVAGPASRACGSCHRADMINEDDAGKLAAFNAHTKANGYLVEDAPGVLDTVIETIMSVFK